MEYQASKATGRGPHHAVLTAARLTRGLTYKAVCGVMVYIDHQPSWSDIQNHKCPKCSRLICGREARP